MYAELRDGDSVLLQDISAIVAACTSNRDVAEGDGAMNKRLKIAAGCAVAAVLLGVGGGIAMAWPSSTPAPQSPVANGPDVPGQPDLPEPGDLPDGPGH